MEEAARRTQGGNKAGKRASDEAAATAEETGGWMKGPKRASEEVAGRAKGGSQAGIGGKVGGPVEEAGG